MKTLICFLVVLVGCGGSVNVGSDSGVTKGCPMPIKSEHCNPVQDSVICGKEVHTGKYSGTMFVCETRKNVSVWVPYELTDPGICSEACY